MFERKSTGRHSRITVPDLDASALMQQALQTLQIGPMTDTRLIEWDFWRTCEEGLEIEGRGRTFEVVRIGAAKNSFADITPESASHFLDGHGAKGHVGAFLSWLMVEQPLNGLFTTVPPVQERLQRRPHSLGYFPCAEARHGYGVNELSARWLGEEWPSRCEYLGFRLVSV